MSFFSRIREWFRPVGVQSVAGPLPMPVVAVGEAPDWPAILAAAGFVEPAMWARHLAFPAARRGIHRGRRAAAFAATIAHESGGGAVRVGEVITSAFSTALKRRFSLALRPILSTFSTAL